MATAPYSRGSNPVWSFVDLTGKQCDDTFYMFVLDNEIPYQPLTIWHDPQGNIPWSNPIPFLANGTLPIDMFWDPAQTYRLEIRQSAGFFPPSQSDPLIYLIENYTPGTGGGVTPGTVGIFTDNQITNPQFVEASFTTPFDLAATNPDDIELAPGWFLHVEGTGTIHAEIIALNNALETPTNAPYCLRLTLSGWTGNPYIYQRFQQNGMLWANKSVSSSVTARMAVPSTMFAKLVDSNGSDLATVLSPTTVSTSFETYNDFGTLGATSNPNLPPSAYIEYQLVLPANVDIYVTSFQLIASDLATIFDYEQDTVDRQIDHLFHYYQDSVVVQPKNTILTGWNFPLNPFQFSPTTLTTVPNQTQYVADQTILYSHGGANTLLAGESNFTERKGLAIKGINGHTDNRFALIQYVDQSLIRPYWSYLLSSLAKCLLFSTHGTSIGIKMRLIYRSTTPPLITNTEPIASWAGVNPVFAAGWTAVAPKNDPTYTLPIAYSTPFFKFPDFPFDGFQMPNCPSTAACIGIVLYTTGNLNVTLGSEDSIAFDSISLVRNDFAVASPPQTFDDVVRECQYYYQKSYNNNILPLSAGAVANGDGQYTLPQTVGNNGVGGLGVIVSSLYAEYEFKRISVPLSAIHFYSPNSGAIDTLFIKLYKNGSMTGSANIASTNYSFVTGSQRAITFHGNNSSLILGGADTFTNQYATVEFHLTIDVRLGTGI